MMQRVHHVVVDRAVDPNDDSFDLSLVQGTNRILVEVDNGSGGWGFALRICDEEGNELIPLPDNVKANPAQHAELSRHIWHGGLESLFHGQSSAITSKCRSHSKSR